MIQFHLTANQVFESVEERDRCFQSLYEEVQRAIAPYPVELQALDLSLVEFGDFDDQDRETDWFLPLAIDGELSEADWAEVRAALRMTEIRDRIELFEG